MSTIQEEPSVNRSQLNQTNQTNEGISVFCSYSFLFNLNILAVQPNINKYRVKTIKKKTQQGME